MNEEKIEIEIGKDVNEFVRMRASELVERWGIKKVIVGKWINIHKNSIDTKSDCYQRAHRFLYGKANIKFVHLLMFALNVNKPISYFLPSEEEIQKLKYNKKNKKYLTS